MNVSSPGEKYLSQQLRLLYTIYILRIVYSNANNNLKYLKLVKYHSPALIITIFVKIGIDNEA